ncbi:lantibiotic dehydratase [Dactylosporangium sp. NPDC051541]|uniref:lantibiotic dehydratase n=1 Tax=Dactylosporangium sp. NPDC051541 TaxID=3363977 RepID=UPI0037BCA35D
MTTDFVLPSGVRVASPVIVRMAGLPARALDRLRCADSFALAADVARRRAGLAAEGTALSDILHTVIGEHPGAPEKPALVGLRRAVFQARRPTTREWNAAVTAVLGPGLTGRLDRWMSTVEECERLTARLPALLAEEIEAGYTELRAVVAAPAFQRALSRASPALFAEAGKWLADEAHRPRRQSLVRLVKYVARAAAKTSPFSTFTSSGAARWAPVGPDAWPTGSGPVRGVLELNGYLLLRLRDALRADPRLVASLPLRVNPSATVHGDVVRFLGRPPAEPILSLPATPAVRRCLEILGGGREHTPAGLRTRLGGDRTGAAAVDRFLDRLVEAGLLHREVPVGDQAADPLGALSRWLTGQSGAEVADATDLIDRVRSGLRAPAAVDDVEDHLVRQRALTAAVGALNAWTGRPADGPGPAEFDAVHENAVIAGPVGALSIPGWRPALSDLDVVRRLLGPLDPALPLRVSLGEYCAARFGPGARTPFLLLYEAMARDLAGTTAPERGDAVRDLATFVRAPRDLEAPLADSHLPRLRELGRVRQDLWRLLLSAPARDGARHTDPAAVLRLSAGWPRWITAPASVAWYVQVVPGQPVPRLVVNAVHGGYGRGRSRALHLIRQAEGATSGAPPDLPPAAAGGPVLAELSGMFGFSPNVRLAGAPYEIDYPFTVSDRPARERIALGDLTVVHDPVSGLARLHANGLGPQVRALHLGMMADALLPPAARILSLAFGAGHYPITGMPQPASAPADVLAYPRVEIGHVTLRRARWVAPTHLVPVRDRGETDAGYLLRLVAWTRSCGVPDRSFVRGFAPRLFTPSADSAVTWVLDKSHKPVYLDLANWAMVLDFERMLKGCGPVVIFEEVRPDPADAGTAAEAGARVAEFVVELSEPGSGRD